ncbi:MAG: uroporphyrinogen-III C-methyltransferase [Desulfovibrionaceae bacterium]|nr:uroporphyrinogen-III C-methyltransferase [Desulfovibrionaceae bacterium]
MKVYLVGAGPGDPGLLTLKARDILEKADVVVYDALVNTRIVDYAKESAERIYVGKIAGNHALPQDKINELLIDKAREGLGRIVVRLKGGDPYIFGRGGEEAQALLAAGIPFEEIPGITSAIAAPAYAGIPLTHRDMVSQVTIITGHEKEEKENSAIHWDALAKGGGTLVFVMGMHTLPKIAEKLMANGLPGTTPAAVIYRGTTAEQKSVTADLAHIASSASKAKLTNPSVIVVGHVASLSHDLNWFAQKPLFGQRIVVTRAREQASGLVSLLHEAGASVLECPTIRTDPMESYARIDSAIGERALYQWILFTSANGVRYFFERVHAAGLDSRAFGTNRFACIGPGTVDALSAHGIRCDCLPERFIAEALVEALLVSTPQNERGRVLIPRAEVARDILPKALTEHGFTVDVVPCYKTVADGAHSEAVREGLRNKTISCITFTSTSTVKNFLRFVPKEEIMAQDVKLAAIGPITAKAIREAGLTCAIEASEYTIPALVASLIAALTK